jgi:hypothetical protein
MSVWLNTTRSQSLGSLYPPSKSEQGAEGTWDVLHIGMQLYDCVHQVN